VAAAMATTRMGSGERGREPWGGGGGCGGRCVLRWRRGCAVTAVVTVVAVLDVCVVGKSAWRRRRWRRRGCVWRLWRRWPPWWPGCVVRHGEGGLAAKTVAEVHGALSGRTKRSASMRRFLSMKPPTCRPSYYRLPETFWRWDVTEVGSRSLEHSHQCQANAILGTRCRNESQIRRWPVLGVGNNVERARGVANGGQAS